MADTYTIKDVTQDLALLMPLTKIFEASPDNFWYDPVEDKKFVYKMDANEEGRQIAIFQDPMPKGDFYYFNPFAEGFGKKSPAVSLFYKMVRIAFNLNARTALLYMAEAVLACKEAATANTEYHMPHAVVRMSSIPIEKRVTIYDAIDDKMIEEFRKLFNRMEDELLFVPYLPQQMLAKVTCEALSDPQWDEKYGDGIRKKSLAAFKAALMGVFGIEKPEDLEKFWVKYDPDLKSSARFHTTLTVYLKLYSQFNDVLADAYAVDGVPSVRNEINLGELSEIIDRFPLAYAIAKHMVQPVLPKVGPTDTGTIDTSRLKIGGEQPARCWGGPEVVDDLGRKTRSGASLQFGRGTEPSRRFSPHIIGEAQSDPFAPATRTSNTMGSGFSSGGGGSGGYFGGGGSQRFSNDGPSLNFQAPSNFGSPGTARTYFG